MDSVKTFDLIIVGAGPAGLSTAMHLLKSDESWGERMIVLEKAVHPRPKLCGGGITPFGLRILLELGFDLPIPLPQARVNNVLITYRSRKIHVRGEPLFVVFNRAEFDHILFQKARNLGVTIIEDEVVKSLEVKPEGVMVVTNKGEYLTQVVVGADGPSSIVRGSTLKQNEPKRIARTLDAIIPTTFMSNRFIHNSALFDFTHVKTNLQGYVWDFPTFIRGDPALNRGVYDSRFISTRPRADLPDILKKSSKTIGGDPPPGSVRGYPIHWFSPSNQISGYRILLVGDAAGAEVFFGEGISPGLNYGKVAADEIAKAFNKNNFRFFSYRRHILFSPLGRYFLPRWLLANFTYRLGNLPIFMHIIFTVCQILATIWHVITANLNREYPNETS